MYMHYSGSFILLRNGNHCTTECVSLKATTLTLSLRAKDRSLELSIIIFHQSQMIFRDISVYKAHATFGFDRVKVGLISFFFNNLQTLLRNRYFIDLPNCTYMQRQNLYRYSIVISWNARNFLNPRIACSFVCS